MTVCVPPSRPRRSAAHALWFAVLALLLSVQSATGRTWVPQPVDGVEQVSRVAAIVPPAAQFRDAGKVVQASARALSPKYRGDPHGGDPALPTDWVALTPPRFPDETDSQPTRRSHPRVHRAAERYHARAPPQAG